MPCGVVAGGIVLEGSKIEFLKHSVVLHKSRNTRKYVVRCNIVARVVKTIFGSKLVYKGSEILGTQLVGEAV